MEPKVEVNAVHDATGNIKSIFATISDVGAQQTLVPSRGYFVSRVELGSPISNKFKLMNEQEANDLRELRKHQRVDASLSGTLVRRG
jgi:hypothetical protein